MKVPYPATEFAEPGPTRYRWAVLAAGTFAQTTYSAIWYGVAVMAPTLRARYHLSLGQTGVLISASLAGSLFSLIPWGYATDRVGERAVLLAGLGPCGVALIAAAGAHGFWMLCVLLVLAGLTGSGVQAASGRSVMQWFGPAQRGFALGIRQTAIPLSGFAVSLLLPAVVRWGGIGWGFASMGIAVLAGAALGCAVLRTPPRTDSPEAEPLGPSPLRDLRIWTLSIGSGLLIAPQLCVAGFTVLYLHDRRGLSDSVAAVVLAVMQLLAVAGRVGAGRWSDHAASRLKPLRAIALASAASVGLLAAILDAPLAGVVPLLIVAGAVSMSWNGLSFAAALEFAAQRRGGAAIGLQQTVLNLPGAAYPALFAALVAATSWRLSFAALALFPLAGRTLLRRLS